MDLITAGLAVTIMSVGVATRSHANSTIGLALFSAASIGSSAKQLILHLAKLEISMAAVERVRAFAEETASEDTTSEDDSGSKFAAAGHYKAWNGGGSIAFRNVSAAYTSVYLGDHLNSFLTLPFIYRSSLSLVLNEVSFNIQPGQRYAICGRTGRYVQCSPSILYSSESSIS